jgi:hypothetical protein
MKKWIVWRGVVVVEMFLSLSVVLALSCHAWGVGPSENKGRRDTYSVSTSKPGYNYYVYVPKSYSDDDPAGIHLYFPGQGGFRSAPDFGTWAKYFLEPYNLIGINMQYMDGDNLKDTGGKVAAAVEAIAQVNADYKIIRGRGVICSFSGGGFPHTLMGRKYGMAGASPGEWPFSHAAAYDSNMNSSIKGWAAMSWFVGLGSKEWGFVRIGPAMTDRAHELFEEAAAGRCQDVYLKFTLDKGHGMSDEDCAESAKIFHRSDLASRAFLYEPDFAGTALEFIVKKANRLELGAAATDLKNLLAGTSLKPEIRKKAETVQDRIDKRVDAVIEVSKDLAQNDPLLWGFYGGVFAKQLRGHSRFDEFKKIEPPKGKRHDPNWALSLFASDLKTFFANGPVLSPGTRELLEKVKVTAGEQSSLGRMATEFLMLPDK